MTEITQTFAADPDEIPRVREFVAAVCHEHWRETADARAISDLRLAVSETFSNILLHGGVNGSTGTIDVALSVDPEQISVRMSYDGCAFAPQRAPAPDFSGRSESGFGLYLIQQTMDEMHFSSDPAGRCVIRLVRNRRQG